MPNVDRALAGIVSRAVDSGDGGMVANMERYFWATRVALRAETIESLVYGKILRKVSMVASDSDREEIQDAASWQKFELLAGRICAWLGSHIFFE